MGEGVFLTFFATDRSETYLSDHFTVAPHVTTLAPYMKSDEHKYAHTTSNTHVVQPWAFFMFLYQLPVWFPGVVFFAVLVAGLVLLIRRWRGWGVYAGLAWGVAVVNLVVPIAAVELDYRYALSAVPFACLALGLACIREARIAGRRRPPTRPPYRQPGAADAPAGPVAGSRGRAQLPAEDSASAPVGFRPWQTRSGARTGSNWTTRPCASGTPRYSRPMPTGSCSTGPRSTLAAAASRRTTASCCGAACRLRIIDARKGDDLYLIPAEGDPLPPAGTAVRGAVEDERRTALMRTHSGLHVLCGVVFRDFGALVTGGNMEPLTARMDFNLPDVPPGFREAVESACNAEVLADRRIDARVLPRDEAFALPDIIRTATNLVPPEVKEVRIIDIVGLDQQADGGTHVASTRQVGRIEVVKIESKGKGFRRLRIRIAD